MGEPSSPDQRDWTPVRQALETGLAEGVCTAVSLLVGRFGRVLFRHGSGRVSDLEGAEPAGPDTVFDLASLTKVLATVPACLALVRESGLDLDRPLGGYLDDLAPHLAGLTLAHLLAHTSGLPAWHPFFQDLAPAPLDQKGGLLLELLNRAQLEYPPGQKTVYSDLGFMLLQLLIERITGQGLNQFADQALYHPLGLDLSFRPLDQEPGPDQKRIAASEHCPWRQKLLQGEVNDENAWSLGGVGGQAGLFGNARAVFKFMEWLRGSITGQAKDRILDQDTAGLVLTNPFPGQPRTLGFDHPAEKGSSAGELFDQRAVGHLGFTGTSLWLEPESGLTVILLTNRTVFGRDNLKIRQFRPLVHNLIKGVLE